MISIITILFGLYAYYEGFREGLYYHFRWYKPFDKVKDEHVMFTLQRSIVFILCLLSTFILYGYWGFFIGVPASLIFPYMHDGSYYKKRNDMDSSVYKNRWKDDTSSSTAKISIKYKTRLAFFILGCLIAVGLDVLFMYIKLN